MGIRVLKTAAAAVLAIYIAEWLSLQFALSAGLLAILGVDVTRRKGLHSAAARFIASLLGLLFGTLVFWLAGFHIWVLAIYILAMYPLLSKFDLRDGIITSSVIVFHVFTAQQIGLAIIWNEVLLLFVGLGTATAVNFVYMPKLDNKIKETKRRTEQLFSDICLQIARHLKDSSYVWDGNEVIVVQREIESGIELARKWKENNLFAHDDFWLTYFEMRRRQLESMHRMMALVAQVYEDLPHGEIAAELFTELSEDLVKPHYIGRVETHMNALEQQFKAMPLPVTRSEFETRSAIRQLCVELKQYIAAAKSGKQAKA